MPSNSLKWLHLSDFHVGKDNYGQICLFDSIIDHIKKHINPLTDLDIIFISGDIANHAKTDEYDQFLEFFLFPISDIISDFTKIVIVPGNHDVNREESKAVKRYNIIEDIPEFFDPDEKGLKERKQILPRFKHYVNSGISDFTVEGKKWIFSEKGLFTYIYEKNGYSIGIIGINTAWLSGGDEDKTNLSPGKELVQNGLKEVQKCDYKIVLGHHPLEWFDEDMNPISALFGKNNVIYLHGHLHKTNACQQYGAGNQFLTIQTGAAFQARENEKWKNRLLWCELNLGKRLLMVKPMQWSKQNQEWSIEGGAFPEIYRKDGTDVWVLPISQKKKRLKKNHEKDTESDNFNTPNGWISIDKQFLSDRTFELDDESIIKFFNGRLPIWREALSPKIPRRSIVYKIVKNIIEAKGMQVTLITGAGGEGKSTVLLQSISDLVLQHNKFKVLWINQVDGEISWPIRYLHNLQKGKERWLIACDNSDMVCKKIFETLQIYYREERSDMQFLLCCRDTDWIEAKANEWNWARYCTFNKIQLRGISREDCFTIVDGWSKFGEDGLGRLNGLPIKEAAERFFIASKNAENQYDNEGAFFGAMLRARIGDKLSNHILEIFNRLKTRTAVKITLLEAYAYIAAMHAEGLSIFTKDIFAELLNCKPGEIKQQIIGPLGDEAVATTGGEFIYTRHRAIAEESIKILSDIYHIDFDDIYIELAESAIRARNKGVYIPLLSKWRFMSSHFFNKGNRTLAIKLTQALLNISRGDPYLTTNLSKLFRHAGEPIQAAQVFRDRSMMVEHRSYFFEWGTAEGHCDNHCLSIYLSGISLSDQVERKFVTNNHAKLCLNGMEVAFSELYKKYNKHIFLEAASSVAQLALLLNLDQQSEYFAYTLLEECKQKGIKEKNPIQAFNILKDGIFKAWEMREIEISESLLQVEQLTYDNFLSVLGIKSNVSSHNKANSADAKSRAAD